MSIEITQITYNGKPMRKADFSIENLKVLKVLKSQLRLMCLERYLPYFKEKENLSMKKCIYLAHTEIKKIQAAIFYPKERNQHNQEILEIKTKLKII